MRICGRSKAGPEAGALNKVETRGIKMPIRVFSEKEKREIESKMFEAGMELIKTYGLTHASVAKITHAAGIGKSTFYNFFASKEDFVIALIKYEREKSMEAIHTLLNGRKKMSMEEGKSLLRMIIYHQDSIYQYLTEEDMKNLYPAMHREGIIEEDLSSDTPEYLLSIMEGVKSDVDAKVFVNFLRMMAICMTQKDSLHQDVLEQNIDLIFEKMYEYVFVA